MPLAQKAHIFFLAAVLCVGMARVALLPPFEGVDETAHYSRILASAFPPEKARDAVRISRDVYDYTATGPMSQGWIMNPTMHQEDPRLPHDGKRAAAGFFKNYRRFFETPESVEKFRDSYAERPATRVFTPSPETNWQMQHPPLYYMLMGVLCRALPDGITLPERLSALRAASFLIAFAGFAMAGGATLRHLAAKGNDRAAAIAAFGAFYPFVMPAFFNDLARIGNDSLTLGLFGVMWVFLLRHLRRPHDESEAIGLGIAAGFALLVKATMLIPVCLIFLYLSLRHLRARDWRGLRHAAFAAVGASLLCMTWYVHYFSDYTFLRSSSGMRPFLLLGRDGGGDIALRDALLSILYSLHGAAVHFSDWLGIRLPRFVILTTTIPALWVLGFYAAEQVRSRKFLSDGMLPAWVFPPVLGVLALHSVATLTLGFGIVPTPAYYVHIVAPALALAMGIGFAGIRDGQGILAGRAIAAMLACAGLGFTTTVFWMQSRLYAGCWWKKDGSGWLVPGDCPGDLAVTFGNLDVLSAPRTAAGIFITGILLAATGLALTLLATPQRKKGEPSVFRE